MNLRLKMDAIRQTKLLVVAFACGWACPARAQHSPAAVPQFEAAAEYSYIRANPDNANGGFNLNGASGSFAYNFNDRFSAVVDLGAYRFGGLPSGVESTMYTYMFGPRLSLQRSGRVIPFAQVLLGGGRLNASSAGVDGGENGFAMAMGGGIDLRFHSRFSIRLVQADYLLTRFRSVSGASATQNNLRLSTGFVFHFGSRN